MYVVGKHDVELAAERRQRSHVDVEPESDPQTQKTGVDHDSVGQRQGAQDETRRRLVEHRVLECSFLTETLSELH